jgi:membrane peptidoglycan carboxypeptidase
MALHLRDQEMSLRDIAKRLVITTEDESFRQGQGVADHGVNRRALLRFGAAEAGVHEVDGASVRRR